MLKYIGREKITIRRSKYFKNEGGNNYFYIHSTVENNVGKIVSIVKILNNDDKELGQKKSEERQLLLNSNKVDQIEIRTDQSYIFPLLNFFQNRR